MTKISDLQPDTVRLLPFGFNVRLGEDSKKVSYAMLIAPDGTFEIYPAINNFKTEGITSFGGFKILCNDKELSIAVGVGSYSDKRGESPFVPRSQVEVGFQFPDGMFDVQGYVSVTDLANMVKAVTRGDSPWIR